MGGIQPWHIILVVVVFLLLFGGKKLPDAARGLGRSLRILKSEVSAMHDDDAKPTDGTESGATAAVPTAPSQIASAPLNAPTIAQPSVQVPGAAPVAAPVFNGQPSPVVVPVSVPAPVINVPTNGQNAPLNGQQTR